MQPATEGENTKGKIASELNITLDFFFLYLLPLSSVAQVHLRGLCIVLDMKVIER